MMPDLPDNSDDTRSRGKLYIVATPIGNLGDMTQRAKDTLAEVDYIAAEDTRHSGRLMRHFNIATPLIAYHEHSGLKRQHKILDLLSQGKSVALISDAGTPLISDPGYQLVKEARESFSEVTPIPGASALITALSSAGLPSDRFVFEGFLPAKSGARQSQLEALAKETRTLIFYESTHRILDSLMAMAQSFGEQREVVIARELTKTYETFLRGNLKQIRAYVEKNQEQQKGEFVVLVKGYDDGDQVKKLDGEAEDIMKILLAELSVKQAAAIGAKLTGIKKRDLYQWALKQ